MTDEKEFTKIHAETTVAREVKAIAALKGKPVYKVIEEMLTIYKAATDGNLPSPINGVKVKAVRALPKGNLELKSVKKIKSH